MFFLASKLLHLLLRPSALIVGFLVAGLLARAFGRGRLVVWGGRAITVGVGLTLLALEIGRAHV